MSRLPDDRRLPPHARGAMVTAGLLTGVVTLAFAASAFAAFGDGVLSRISLVHALTAFAISALTVVVRRLTLGYVLAAEMVIVAPFFAEVWLRHLELVQTHATFAPFQGLKLVMLGIAVVVPAPVWVHLFWLGGFGVLAALMWFNFNLAAMPPQFLVDEPWFTFVFWVASVGFLLFRWRNESLARRLMAAEARSRAFVSVARLFLRMRDETNTPLQNIRLGVELLASRHPEDIEVVSRIQSAVNRVEQVRTALGRYDHLVAWDGSELTADPELEALLAELEQAAKTEHEV